MNLKHAFIHCSRERWFRFLTAPPPTDAPSLYSPAMMTACSIPNTFAATKSGSRKKTTSAHRDFTVWQNLRCERKPSSTKNICWASLAQSRAYVISKTSLSMPPNKARPWERHARQTGRPGHVERRRVLIVCEDSKSSRFYFEGFPVAREQAIVKAVGTGMNTDSLIEEAVRLRDKAQQKGAPFSN